VQHRPSLHGRSLATVIDRFHATQFNRQVLASTTEDATGSCRPISDIRGLEFAASKPPVILDIVRSVDLHERGTPARAAPGCVDHIGFATRGSRNAQALLMSSPKPDLRRSCLGGAAVYSRSAMSSP